jgi:hypothetical protein
MSDLTAKCRVAGPAQSGNLAVYLFVEDKGSSAADGGKPLLALEEALDRNLVVVRETDNVNLLEIENLSEAEDVYVQSGDIVKGGKQDRVLGIDLILPPKSGRMPIRAFCVERGRWAPRGEEASDKFSSSKHYLASTELKASATYGQDQGAVWESVGELQESLTRTSAFRTGDLESATSLQLTLESSETSRAIEDRLRELEKLVQEAGGPVAGAAFAINGQFVSADVYNSSNLFLKYWPRLLRAAATEAAAKLQPDTQNTSPPPAKDATTWIALARRPAPEERRATDRVVTRSRQTETTLLSETFDAARGEEPVHLNCVTNALGKVRRGSGPYDTVRLSRLTEEQQQQRQAVTPEPNVAREQMEQRQRRDDE